MTDSKREIFDETSIAPAPDDVNEGDLRLGGADPLSYKGHLTPGDEDFIGNQP